jgi:hypothetical protein
MANKKKFVGKKRRQPSLQGNRFQVNVLMGAILKDMLLEAAARSGRTTSTEAAFQIESGIYVNNWMAFCNKTFAQVKTENLEHALGEHTNLVMARDLKTGLKAWYEPGHPAIAGLPTRGGFTESKPGEVQAHLEQKAAVSGISDAEVEASNQQKLESADVRPNFDVYESLDSLDKIEATSNAPKDAAA